MPPQDPNNPNPAPFPEAPPAGVPPQAPQQPVAPPPQAQQPNPYQVQPQPQPQPQFQPQAPQPTPQVPNSWQQPDPFAPPSVGKKKRKRLVLIFLAVFIVFVLVVGGWFAYTKWFSSIGLEEYSTDNYSVMVPVGYERTDGDFTEFKEPGPEETQSEVMTYYMAMPEGTTSEQVKELRALLKSELEGAAENLTNPNEKVENLNISDVTYKGQEALELTATMTKDGKKEGDVKLIAIINENQFYMIGVGAHVSDPGVKKKMDDIINSFTLK